MPTQYGLKTDLERPQTTIEMTDLLSTLTSLLPEGGNDKDYDSQIRDIIAYLKQSLINKNTSIVSSDDHILDILDPSLHTLPYLFMFRCHVRAVQSKANEALPESLRPGGYLWSKAVVFLKSFDPVQVRYAGHEWRQLVELVVQGAETASKSLLAVLPVRDAVLRLDPSCATLTSTHLMFARLCLRARAYTHALPVIDKYICHFPASCEESRIKYGRSFICAQQESSAAFITDTSGLSVELRYRDHLQYFLYGGMIHMALKRWSKALHFLKMVVCSPIANSVSMIMVEAYKKWILVSLLEHGKLITLPSVVAPHTAKVYQSLARPYVALAGVFEKGNYERLKAEVGVGWAIWQAVGRLFPANLPRIKHALGVFTHLSIFIQDNNTGMVCQVVRKFFSCAVFKLGTVFAALAMADVAKHLPHCPTSIEELESFVASLIMCRNLDASLLHPSNQSSTTTLRFSAMVSKFHSQKTRAPGSLAQEGLMLQNLMYNVRESDRVLELCNEHIENFRRSQSLDSGTKGDTNMTINKATEFDIDEDMMGDLR